MNDTPLYTSLATAGDNARIEQALASPLETPTIAPLPQDEITLPGGLILRDGSVARRAVVRELMGSHEEAIARARTSGNFIRFLATLVECGTASIGGITPTREQILDLLGGDWVALMVAIRCATYGSTLDLGNVLCPHCNVQVEVTVNLDELPTTSLSDPVADRVFSVELRHGRKAQVAFPTGRDQEAVYERANLSVAERNTLTLSRCVRSVTEANGMVRDLQFDPGYVRDHLSIPDRRTIIDELMRREPGPRLEELSFNHNDCGKEVAIPLEIADLFRDM